MKKMKIAALALAVVLGMGLTGVASYANHAGVPHWEIAPNNGKGVCSTEDIQVPFGSAIFNCEYAFQFDGKCWYVCEEL